MDTEQPPEGSRLGFTQLRKFGSNMLYGAVVLAELQTEPLLAHSCGVAI